jgi:hypothetical protein
MVVMLLPASGYGDYTANCFRIWAVSGFCDYVANCIRLCWLYCFLNKGNGVVLLPIRGYGCYATVLPATGYGGYGTTVHASGFGGSNAHTGLRIW